MIINNQDDSDTVSPNSYIGDLSTLGRLSAFASEDFSDNEKANIPDEDAVLKARTVSGSDKSNPFTGDKIDLNSLLKTYNKNRYYSPTASLESSYFKIGPLVYGGEVQEIKILESKAIQVVPGARTNNDFLTDDGTGNADIQVSMIFSGRQHIIKGLVPLIALHKVSPITSVKNKVIEAALYNKFTENDVPRPDHVLIDKAEKILTTSIQIQEHTKILQSLGIIDRSTVNIVDYLKAQHNGLESIQNKTYEEWLHETNNLKYFIQSPNDGLDVTKGNDIAKELDKTRNPLSKIDYTGHVPVAFVGLSVTTHPEYVESFIVTLSLKRVSVGNFLRDYLQYRTIDNKPTPDARKAFWLNRAIDIYIDKYYSDPEIYLAGAFDLVNLQFAGDKLLLKHFKNQTKLHNLTLAANRENRSRLDTSSGTTGDVQKDIAVTELTYSISNKFAFTRLAGESYPTVQHMGVSSGSMLISIRTNSNSKFEQIHTYKSAADYFIRSADRADRFSGWKVDCILTRLFNTKENPTALSSKTIANSKLFYPLNVISATTESPNTRDLVLTLAETTAEFFSDFGFVLITNGLSVEIMKKFYDKLYSQANINIDTYGHSIFYGSGSSSEKFSLINPDTIVASLVERDIFTEVQYESGKEYKFKEKVNNSSMKVLNYLQRSSKYSGESRTTDTLAGLEQVADASVGIFSNVYLPGDIALDLFNDNFILTTNMSTEESTSLKNNFIRLLQGIGNKEDRESLYSLIYLSKNLEKIDFTSNFIEHLFVSLVKRSRVPLSDRLYNRSNVALAYDSLERAIIVRSEEIDVEAHAELARSKATDNAIVYNPDGALEISQRRITAYPDYLYITFKQLFELDGLPSGYWREFGYTYQDLGIINPELADYSTDKSQGIDMYTTSRAQSELVTTETSPIPPSIFFYREKELNDLRLSLDTEYRNWFDNLSTLHVTIPYDIDFLVSEAGRITGDRGIIGDTGEIASLDKLGNSEKLGLASIIEAQNNYIRSETLFNDELLREAGEDAAVAQFKKAKAKLNFGHMKDGDFRQKIDQLTHEDPSNPLVVKYNKYIQGDGFEAFVPIVFTSHKDKEVATYKKVSGTVGSIVYKDVIKRAAKNTNQTVDSFLDDILKRNAAGFDDGISLSNSSFEECYNAALKSTQIIPDNRNDLIKAFPVFRLYIIDYNKGDRIFVKDNFYGYNAIQSIDITLDKNDADLAIIRVADPLQILQGGVFDDKLVWNRGVVRGLSLPSSSDDGDSNFLARFELKQGRAIQIRGGYSADPDNLDILFTGRISEVQFGDVVTIIAQGWKAELAGKQVDFELTSVENSSVKDLVVRTIRDSNPAGMGPVISQDELNQLIPLQSKFAIDDSIVRSIQNQFGTFGGDSGNSGFEGWLGLHFFGNKKQGLDLRLKNIWAPDNDKTRFGYFADSDTTGWEGDSWLIPMQPAWDVLQNATNYIWGYICQVVPYDGEATLFFGRPEQLYYYTKGSVKELTEYRKLHLRAQLSFVQSMEAVFNDFLQSQFYNGGSLISYLAPFVRQDKYDAFVINTEYTDYITMPIKMRFDGRDSEFDTEQFSFLSYKSLLNSVGRFAKIVEGGRASISHTKVANLYDGEIPDIIEKNLGISFYQNDFPQLATAFGSDTNASYFLLSTFFGFSEKFINQYLYPPNEVTLRLLTRHNRASIDGLKRDLLDRFPSGSLLQDVNDRIDINILNGVDVSAQSRAVSELTDPQAGDFSLTVPGALARPTQTYTLTYNNKNTPKEKVINYLNALSFYFNASKDISNIIKELPKDQGYNILDTEVDPDDLSLGIRVNIRAHLNKEDHDTIVAVLSNQNRLKDLKNSAINLFNNTQASKDINVDTQFAILDQRFTLLARRLGGLSPLDDELDSIDSQELVEYIVNGMPMFRVYVHYLADFIRNTRGSTNTEAKDNMTHLSNTNYFKFPPALNMKPFRDYHYVASGVEIIENNIAASTREMYNTVVIRGPRSVTTSNDATLKLRVAQGDYDSVVVDDVQWQTWPIEDEENHMGWQFNDSITLDSKKLGVFTDLNVRRRDQAAKVATNVMAKFLRPMYRNNLLLMGRSIKPWDHIHLDDKYIDMWGPIEVERVIHHYNAENGWRTNIVPHAVAEANPGNSAIQRALMANKFDKIYNLVDNALWAITILTAIPTLGASVGALASGVGFGARTALKSRLLQSVAFLQKQNVQKFAADFATKQMLSDKFNILKTTLIKNAPTTVRAYGYSQLSSYGLGEITRGFYLNSTVGTLQAPVTISPLLFKGMPFEAGLKGRETTYYSLTSRLYWAYKDVQQGLDNVGSFITDTFKVPNPTSERVFLEGLRQRTQ